MKTVLEKSNGRVIERKINNGYRNRHKKVRYTETDQNGDGVGGQLKSLQIQSRGDIESTEEERKKGKIDRKRERERERERKKRDRKRESKRERKNGKRGKIDRKREKQKERKKERK